MTAADTLLPVGLSEIRPDDVVSKDVLLIVFVHGFKGTDETFGEFPQRIQHVLSESIPETHVESIVFPAYETKGDLNEAVVRFADWLTTLTVEKEVAVGGAGKAKIVLCGHSMGGLLIADTALEFSKSRPDKSSPLWPRIIACIAFDTPYLGLHPHVFKNQMAKAADYMNTAQKVGSAIFGAFAGLGVQNAAAQSALPANRSSWAKLAAPAAYAVGGAMLAGAAAGGAYYKREELGIGYSWVMDHMKYVGNLWDEDALKKRTEALLTLQDEGVLFRNFYTYLPPTPPIQPARTFIVLPKRASALFKHFKQAPNGVAPDEIQAHTGMFGSKTNDGYYELGLAMTECIREAYGAVENAEPSPVHLFDKKTTAD